MSVQVIQNQPIAIADDAPSRLAGGANDSALTNRYRTRHALQAHGGPALVTTVTARLDYVGATAHVTASLPAHAFGGVVFTQAVYSDLEVSRITQTYNHASATLSAELPGAPGSLLTRVLPNRTKEADA